jgi:hypothetical protein
VLHDRCYGGGADDADEQGELVMRLESHITYLDSLQHSLHMPSKQMRTSKHGAAKQFGVEFLIRALLLARRLRQQSQLASTVSQAVTLLPPALRDAALRCLSEVQSRSIFDKFWARCNTQWCNLKSLDNDWLFFDLLRGAWGFSFSVHSTTGGSRLGNEMFSH